MNDEQVKKIEVGDVLFLERPLEAMHWPSGFYVLHSLTQGSAVLSLLSQDEEGLCGTDDTFTVSVEDLLVFSPTLETGRIPGKS